jgi:dihydropyrimidinase
MKHTLIKGAWVVGETEEGVMDVLVKGEKIAAVGEEALSPAQTPASAPDWEIIDGTGKTLVPGGIDVHTHLCLDVGFAVASDDFYTGTTAAAWGGTTAIVDHPGFGPPGCSLDHQINKYHELAAGRAVIDYGFHGVIQHVDDAVLKGMEDLINRGITSHKIYLTYGYKISDAGAYRVLKEARRLGVMVTVHPENDGVITLLREQFKREGKLSAAYHALSRPAECEAEAINRMILFAGLAGNAPLYIVHLSNALGLSFIRAARERGGKNLFAETCPQYLFLDDSLYDSNTVASNSITVTPESLSASPESSEGLKYIMCPPLRKPTDNAALLEALAGDIDTVATDHCPFFFKTQKMAGKDDFTRCPSGAPGVEERIPLLYSEGVLKKRISLRRFTELCSTNPAKLFGMYPQKGVIRKGSDADLVLLDPEKNTRLEARTQHANVDYCAYEGMEVRGLPVMVMSRGKVVVRDGSFYGNPGDGKFINRGLPRGLNIEAGED